MSLKIIIKVRRAFIINYWPHFSFLQLLIQSEGIRCHTRFGSAMSIRSFVRCGSTFSLSGSQFLLAGHMSLAQQLYSVLNDNSNKLALRKVRLKCRSKGLL